MNNKLTYQLIKHEFVDFFKQPPLWMLVVLPVVMSKVIIGLMDGVDQELMLLPSWIIFAQVMVGLLIIAPGFIEEKEHKTLDALLISPLSLRQIIFAKCFVVLVFSLISQMFVYMVNFGITMELLTLVPMMIIGGGLFVLIGLLVGLTMNSSKTSSAVSSIIMVVLFMTASFYQQFPTWEDIVQFVPSVTVAENIQASLNSAIVGFDLLMLIVWIALLTITVHFLVKRETA
ncbi:hypothetical protein EJF36_02580 [Bacillus sp. HMF5848]|uniref:ABC transporter permease n=1 Tax=Bacillus sp. HMF5848 TaxID=2495421 RepID=UPI000F76DED1|nr:ABC transporter permease [Bacillus sp. HMF5848]RSK25866.1 hypothetical protein EJF36_02580 [Bacillus sp. HMF5848]